MLRQGPIPLAVHAAAEPFLAALLIAAPFLFGFSDLGAPTAVAIVTGIAVLVLGMSTCWRVSLVKVVPVRGHMVLDVALAAILIASPFLFSFSDDAAPTAFFLVVGIGDLLVALGTRWYPAGRKPGAGASGGRRFGRRRGTGDSQPTA
jgi:SPW repeat